MKNTYEEAVLKTVLWWSDKAFRTSLNQNNGDNSSQGGMAFMLMNILAMNVQDKITEEQIKKFEEKLTELLIKNKNNKWERNLNVDYHPCTLLSDAAEYAGINTSCFPCKSSTQIDDQNKVYAKYQYGGDFVEI